MAFSPIILQASSSTKFSTRPILFSYIQSIVDQSRAARFILTGSSNFLLLERIGQTLAGRTAILYLLPLSLEELPPGDEPYENRIWRGAYPRVYDRALAPTDFYPAYIQTYVERDVRLLKNIGDANAFIQFTRLCAGRIGQLLNYTSLASDAGISPNTAKAWLSILEASNEFIKRYFHRGEYRQPYFWQDSRGKEIDCLLEEDGVIPVEIKAGKTISPSYFDNLRCWRSLAALPEKSGYVVYGGDRSLQTSAGMLVSWRDIGRLLG